MVLQRLKKKILSYYFCLLMEFVGNAFWAFICAVILTCGKYPHMLNEVNAFLICVTVYLLKGLNIAVSALYEWGRGE